VENFEGNNRDFFTVFVVYSHRMVDLIKLS